MNDCFGQGADFFIRFSMSPESISPGNNLRRFVTAAEKNRFTRTFLLSDPTLMFVTVSFFFAPSLFWICAFSILDFGHMI